MNKYLLLALALSFSPVVLFSQTIAYEKGQIITKSNDTIKALIELTPTYEGVVHYKASPSASIQKIKIKEVAILKTPYNTFQNISVNKEPHLFRVVINGPNSLFEYSKINVSTSSNAYGGTMTKYGPPALIYAIKTNQDMFIVKQKKDIKQITPLIEKCPDAKNIVDSKTFKLEDLKTVVTKLNKCK